MPRATRCTLARDVRAAASVHTGAMRHSVGPVSAVPTTARCPTVRTELCCWLFARRRRVRDVCKKCPNTAWLLFLMFALVLIALVAISVYLSKKRLNLAILGIGVVSASYRSLSVSMQISICLCLST